MRGGACDSRVPLQAARAPAASRGGEVKFVHGDRELVDQAVRRAAAEERRIDASTLEPQMLLDPADLLANYAARKCIRISRAPVAAPTCG